MTAPAVVYAQLASDSFRRANENPLNPLAWGQDPNNVNSPLQIVGNEAIPTSGESIGVYTGIVWPKDQWAQVQVDACQFTSYVGDAFASVILVGRRTDFHDAYAIEVDGPLGPGCQISFFAEKSGAQTFFVGSAAGGAVIPFFAGDSIRMECFGTTITFKIVRKDGQVATISSVTDSQLVSGNMALDLFEDTLPADAQVSNFVGGSIVLMTGPHDAPPPVVAVPVLNEFARRSAIPVAGPRGIAPVTPAVPPRSFVRG